MASTPEVIAASSEEPQAPGVLSNMNWAIATRANMIEPTPQNGPIASAMITALSVRVASRRYREPRYSTGAGRTTGAVTASAGATSGNGTGLVASWNPLRPASIGRLSRWRGPAPFFGAPLTSAPSVSVVDTT